MTRKCIHCGRDEDEHCLGFEAKKMPNGCTCSEGTWGPDVTPICDKYEADEDGQYCARCEHDKACHTV